MGDRAEAVRCAEEALEIGRILGDDRLIGTAVGFLGSAVRDEPRRSSSLPRRWPTCGEPGMLPVCCWWLIHAAAIELADENPEAATKLLEEDLAICQEVGLPREGVLGVVRPR